MGDRDVHDYSGLVIGNRNRRGAGVMKRHDPVAYVWIALALMLSIMTVILILLVR
jgi:hypothetical protein